MPQIRPLLLPSNGLGQRPEAQQLERPFPGPQVLPGTHQAWKEQQGQEGRIISAFLAVLAPHVDNGCSHAMDSCCQLTLPSVDDSDTTRSSLCSNVMNGLVRLRSPIPLESLACVNKVTSKFGRHTVAMINDPASGRSSFRLEVDHMTLIQKPPTERPRA